MMYVFEDLADVQAHFEQIAADKRRNAENRKKVGEKNALITEAVAFEYAALVIENSNLIKGRIILVDEDLEMARDEIDTAMEAIKQARSDMYDMWDKLNRLKLNLSVPTAAPEEVK